MDPTAELLQPTNTLSVQEFSDGKSCTAHAAINTIELGGISIPADERATLISFTQNNKPLEAKERESLFQKHGLDYHSLSMELLGVERTPNTLFNEIVNILEKHPIGFPISTYLSRRPEELREHKNIYHAVAAIKEGTMIKIIDSYDPKNPEVFNTDTESERLRFLTWFMSARAQDIVFTQGQDKSKESVLKVAQERMTNEDPLISKTFIGESLSTGLSYYGTKK